MATDFGAFKLIPDKTGCDHDTNGPSREVLPNVTAQLCPVCRNEVVSNEHGLRWIVEKGPVTTVSEYAGEVS